MKSLRQYLIISTSIGVILYVLYLAISMAIYAQKFDTRTILVGFLVNMMFSYAFYFGNGITFHFVQSKLRLSWKSPIKTFSIGLIASLVVSYFIGFLLAIIASFIYGSSITEVQEWIFTKSFNQLLERVVWISLTITLIFYCINYLRFNQNNKITSKEIVIQKIIRSNEALKEQIGPHFLFNSLNVLTGLIDENPDRAQDFVVDLSKVYRYVLEQSNKELIPIQEELGFAETYMNLIKTRFEQGVEFTIEPELYQLEKKIIPLSLQLVLENCIKHNAVSKTKRLKIEIFKKENQLIIQNNINPKKQLAEGTKIGIKNIKSKYKQITNQEVVIENTGSHFIVKLPLLTSQIIKMENLTEMDYNDAKERVKEIQGFYQHLASYLVVNIFFLILDLWDDGEWDWTYYLLFSWGIGISSHAVSTFGFFQFNKNWEERKIKQIIARRKKEREEFHNK